jgi:hypothetical protein
VVPSPNSEKSHVDRASWTLERVTLHAAEARLREQARRALDRGLEGTLVAAAWNREDVDAYLLERVRWFGGLQRARVASQFDATLCNSVDADGPGLVACEDCMRIFDGTVRQRTLPHRTIRCSECAAERAAKRHQRRNLPWRGNRPWWRDAPGRDDNGLYRGLCLHPECERGTGGGPRPLEGGQRLFCSHTCTVAFGRWLDAGNELEDPRVPYRMRSETFPK